MQQTSSQLKQRKRFYLLVLLYWLVLMLLGILNGIIRQTVYGPYVGEPWAHHISVFTAMFIMGIAIGLFLYYQKYQYSNKDLMVTGVIWTSLSIAFEFLFGHYIMNHSWDALLEQYNIIEGHLWPLVLAFILFAPMFLGSFIRNKN